MHQLWRHPNGVWYILYGPRRRRRISTRARERSEAEAYLNRYIERGARPLEPWETMLGPPKAVEVAPKRAPRFTQADVVRVLSAIKEVGVPMAVEIALDGTLRIVPATKVTAPTEPEREIIL